MRARARRGFFTTSMPSVARDDRAVHPGIGRGVPGVVDDHELGTGPHSCEVLRAGHALEVVLAVDEHTRYRRERAGVAEQHAVVEEHVVVEVVGAEPSAGELERRVVPSSRPRGVRVDRRRRPVPVGPVAGGPRTDRRIRMLEQPAVRGDEIAVALGLRHAGAESSPRLGEARRDVVGRASRSRTVDLS